MKKPTKKYLFYQDLRELIHSKVTYDLENIEDIKKEVDNYIKNQKHLKRIGKLWGNEAFMFIIAERKLDLIIENLDKFIKNKIIYPFTYNNYLTYIEQEINSIGLYKLCVCSPDVVTSEFIMANDKKIKENYYNYNDETKKQKRVLDLLTGIHKLEKLKGLNDSVDIALDNTKKELNELLKKN